LPAFLCFPSQLCHWILSPCLSLHLNNPFKSLISNSFRPQGPAASSIELVLINSSLWFHDLVTNTGKHSQKKRKNKQLNKTHYSKCNYCCSPSMQLQSLCGISSKFFRNEFWNSQLN
jgi:hypothetical protein